MIFFFFGGDGGTLNRALIAEPRAVSLGLVCFPSSRPLASSSPASQRTGLGMRCLPEGSIPKQSALVPVSHI